MTAIQATALPPQKVYSCRERSIDINLKYLSLSHALSYYTECEYACETTELLSCTVELNSKLWKVADVLKFTVKGLNCI